MKKCFLSLSLLLLTLFLQAQTSPETSTAATGMRANGKIYVVVAILVTILAGLFIYVARVDRKISRLEKQQP
jgi:hypothetical protein